MSPSIHPVPRRRRGTFPAVALMILAVALAAPASLSSASDDLLWLRVEVMSHGEKGTRMKVNVPLSLMEVVIESVDGASLFEKMHGLDAGQGHIDIRKMWQSIRDMNVDEFLTIESEKENVKVYKDRDFFRVDVRNNAEGEEVEIKVPLSLMDYLFEKQHARFDFQELVSALRLHAPLQVVRVEGKGESVSVWIEER